MVKSLSKSSRLYQLTRAELKAAFEGIPHKSLRERKLNEDFSIGSCSPGSSGGIDTGIEEIDFRYISLKKYEVLARMGAKEALNESKEIGNNWLRKNPEYQRSNRCLEGAFVAKTYCHGEETIGKRKTYFFIRYMKDNGNGKGWHIECSQLMGRRYNARTFKELRNLILEDVG
jgi:hypothetical protein